MREIPSPFDHAIDVPRDQCVTLCHGCLEDLVSIPGRLLSGCYAMNTICRSLLQPQAISSPRSAPIVVWTGIARIIGVSGAAFCIVLATLGVFLPVLPTTPFVLLASYLLCRSFPEVHQRFRNSRPFGHLLTDWEERGGIRANDKLRAIVVLLVCSSGTLYVGNLSQTLVVLFLIVIAAGLTVVLRIPIVRDPE